MPPSQYQATIYEVLEDAAIAQLAPLAPDIEVVPWPDSESDFVKAFAKGRISVQCHSSVSGDQLTTDISTSEETVTLHFFLEAKKRRGQWGIFDLKRHVDAVMNGFKPDGWKRFVPAPFQQNERTEQNTWRYNLLYSAVAVNQQQFDDITPGLEIDGLADAIANLPTP
jgi:hypothetical protein